MIKNLSALYGLHFFKYIMPLILIPYLARVLGLSAWGELVIAQAFASYLALIVEYGFELSATKQLARCKNNAKQRSLILSDVMGAKMVLIVIIALLSIPFLFILPVFTKSTTLFLSAMFFAGSSSFNLIWYFQGIEKLVIASLTDILIKSASILFIFLWVTGPKDISLLLIINGVSALIVTIVLFYFIQKDTKIVYPSFRSSLFAIRKGWDMFIYKVSVSFYTTGNALILSFLVSPEIVAIYSGAEKISKAVLGLLTPITQVLYPRFSELTKNSYNDAQILFKQSLVVMSAIGFAMSVGIYLSSDLLVKIILGVEFQEASSILKILASLPILITISNVLGIQWMVPNGMEKAFNKIIIISGLLNLSLAVILAPYFQAAGMAWSVVISELVVTSTMALYLWNYDKHHIYEKRTTKDTPV